MRLYLSSYRVPVPEELFRLIGKAPSEVRMAMVGNAKDKYIPRVWQLKNDRSKQVFTELGVAHCDIIDLREFADDSAAELTALLSAYDLVWANGGNTFMLMYEIRRTGFDEAVRQLLDRDHIVYGGASAGQLVAGPSIHGIELADDPEFAEAVVLGGMNLVDAHIFPHANDPIFTEALADFRAKHGDIITLKNSQAYVVDGDERRVIERSENQK